MKLRWKIVLGVVAVLAAMQLVRPSRTHPPVTGDIKAPPDVASILRRACYDCHSNETAYPWYSQVAPVSWLLWSDVDEGRHELDFSTWSTWEPARRERKQRRIAKEVGSGDMPPWYYLPMHPRAHLSDADKARLVDWSKNGPIAD